jgi:hypothetical protein
MSDLDDSMARHPAGRKRWSELDHSEFFTIHNEMPTCTRLHVAELADVLDPTNWQISDALFAAGMATSPIRRAAFRAGMLYAIEAMRAARPR